MKYRDLLAGLDTDNPRNFSNGAIKIDDLRLFINKSNANVTDNLRLSVKNPISLIYIKNDNDDGQAVYNNNANLPYNWFGTSSSLTPERLGELNLWSDNAKGQIVPSNYNFHSQRRPYNDKSSFDPCPNGWRIPSMFVANRGNASTYVDDVRIDYSPFGLNENLEYSVFNKNILPSDNNMPFYKHGFRIYPQIGFDMRNVNNNDMGVFPGTGIIYRNINHHSSQYADQHETFLWTATMTRWHDTTPSVLARSLRLTPDSEQWANNLRPDAANFPNVYGLYQYSPLNQNETSDALGCRCISDPLYIKNGYDFPTEYFQDNTQEFLDGLDNPNSYLIVKDIVDQQIEIPINKAFSVQSQLLDNENILNTGNFNNLKINVLWTTNKSLIQSITLDQQPNSINDISNSNILVEIAGNQSGNAVVTLHNGSIENPVLWSWHIWVTDSPVNTITYQTDEPATGVTNYINYVKRGTLFKTEFMDRNLGAVDVFPDVSNPTSPDAFELNQIKLSGGLQYQWGRKDPIPSFTNPDGSVYEIYLGQVNPEGSINYTTLNNNSYNLLSGNYIIPYNTYASEAGVVASDKVNEKISKIISYSVKNPLVYMIPSNFAPADNSNPNLTNGTDWISDSTEPNLMADRWGRGGKKSPFDPCPEGWRIPDVFSVSSDVLKQEGHFPWSKKNVSQTSVGNIPTTYPGIKVGNYGFVFNDPQYNIGNYPFVGIRGFRNTAHGGTPDYLPHDRLTGIWTASLMTNYLGRANMLLIDRTYNFMTVQENNADPYFAMNCRCVKIQSNENNQETGPLLELPVEESAPFGKDESSHEDILAMIQNHDIILYPNPVKDYIKIKAESHITYYFQIFDLNGNQIKKGEFINNAANITDLSPGIYIITVNNSSKAFKIIKK